MGAKYEPMEIGSPAGGGGVSRAVVSYDDNSGFDLAANISTACGSPDGSAGTEFSKPVARALHEGRATPRVDP
jgi:hypothetical protein